MRVRNLGNFELVGVAEIKERVCFFKSKSLYKKNIEEILIETRLSIRLFEH